MLGRSRQCDEGSTHVLEAVIIASIMLSAIAFVATFENPVTGSTPTRALLAQKSQDALTVLWDTPVENSDFGDDLLSVLLAQCLQGNCTNLTAKLDRLLPVGASYALYISNGYDTYPVYVERLPVGEAVTATQLVEPHWSYTFTSTGLTSLNNGTDPNIVYSLPVYNSNVVAAGGSTLKVIVDGRKQSDGSDYRLEASYSTQAFDVGKAGQVPAVSLNFLTNRTGPFSFDVLGGSYPGAYWYVVPETIGANGFPSNVSIPFRVRLTESGGIAVPAGTELTINVPRGWNATGWENSTWDVIQDVTDWNGSYNGSDVIARLRVPVQSSSVEFNFNATYRGDLLNQYPFRAALTRGAFAEANMLVGADNWPENTQTFATPRVVASVPKPMGASSTTTWSLAVNVPYTPVGGTLPSKSSLSSTPIPRAEPTSIVQRGGSGPSPVTIVAPQSASTLQGTNIIIDNITILHEGGEAIFGGVVPSAKVGNGVGAWQNGGDRLIWRGKFNTTTQGVLNLTFDVTASGTAGAEVPRTQVLPPVAYSTFTGRLLARTGPGLYRDAFLPNNTTALYYPTTFKGYASDPANATSPLRHDYESNTLFRNALLAGTSNYSVNPASPFTDALYGSFVSVEKRSVPIGGQVVLDANVQSVLYTLSAAGKSAGVKLNFYPPWSGNSRVPIWTLDNMDSGILTSSVTQIVLLDVNADGFPDPIVGTDQGRVIAFDGINGDRIQGSTWVAPLVGGQNGVANIRHLSAITLGGVDYIVVGTDGKSGVYVLTTSFQTAWNWDKTPETPTEGTASMDTSRDIDLDGRRDIVLALDGGGVFVLRALTGSSLLQPLIPATPPPSPSFAFAKGQGTPAAIIALNATGANSTPGIGVSFTSLPGADANVRIDRGNVTNSSTSLQTTIKSPRAGVSFYDDVGRASHTFLGTPITRLAPYDANGDVHADVLAGSTAGYVFLMNGQRAAQPATPVIWVGPAQIVDGDALDGAHSVFLTKDGTVAFTYDGWNTNHCVGCDPETGFSAGYPTARGIAMNGTASFWLVGDASMAWRSVDQANMVSVLPLSATKNGIAYPLLTSIHKFNDVDFKTGAKADEGVIVGTPLQSLCVLLDLSLQGHCDEGLVMYTTNGGQNWAVQSALSNTINGTAGVGSKVTKPLTRVNFTDDDLGWIMGEQGTLLRTLRGGANWTQISVPTTANLRDISCAPEDTNKCIVVAEGGIALRTTNARGEGGSQWPTWENITANLSLPDNRPLQSVGMMNALHGFIGTSNKILETFDGGSNWTDMSMGYVETDGTRIIALPDGTGFVYGGNATVARQFWLHAYQSRSTVITTDLTAALPLPVGATVLEATLNASLSETASMQAVVYLSASDSATPTWVAASDAGISTVPLVSNGQTYSLPTTYHLANFTSAGGGSKARVKVDLVTAADMDMGSAQIGYMDVTVRYTDPADPTGALNRTYKIDLSSTAQKGAGTTATWDTAWRTIHSPLVPKFWSRNVSGGVNDLRTGYNVTGDARQEVWVATGSIIAENSPDYQIYAGTDYNTVVAPDNRVYLLDGATGNVIAKTSILSGEVTNIRLADDNADGRPDIVFASTAAASGNFIFAFNATTLVPIRNPTDTGPWSVSVLKAPVNDLEVGRNPLNATVLSALGSWTQTSSGKTVVNGGAVVATTSYPMETLWSSKADDRGAYVVTKDIPKNWFFGPYVVEVKVDWTDDVTVQEGGTPVTKTIVQSARFYDYFLVTPPDAVNPPSPIYQVHLVSWLDDWS